jgi:hypothetical protein
MIFGTAKITREFSEHIGLEDYHEEPWYMSKISYKYTQ